jgi:hypothetical protein
MALHPELVPVSHSSLIVTLLPPILETLAATRPGRTQVLTCCVVQFEAGLRLNCGSAVYMQSFYK